MAFGEKKAVVMEEDLSIPNGVATLDSSGKLSESQRPEYENKQDKLTGNPGQLIGIGDDGTAKATVYPCNKNLLINWDFTNPVNRNGLTEYTNATNLEKEYCIDRWYYGKDIKINLTGDGLVMSKVGNNLYFLLQLPDTQLWDYLRGKIVTLTALVKGNGSFTIGAINATTSAPFTVNSDAEYSLCSFTYSYPTIIDTAYHRGPCVILIDGSISIAVMKLELGSIQTLAHQENGKWILNEIPDYAEQYVICEQYSPITGEFVGSQRSNENLLDNAYFVGGGSQSGNECFPINRNGKTEYINEMAIDRFDVDYFTLKVEEEGISITSTKDARYKRFRQKTKGLFKSGTTLTLSALAKITELSGDVDLRLSYGYATLIGSARIYLKPTEGKYELFSISYTLPFDVPELSIDIVGNNNAASYITEAKIKAIKLELGPAQTLARKEGDEWVLNEIPNYAEQYAICSQYSPLTGEFVGSQHTNPNLFDNAYFVGGGSQQGGGQFPVNQRIETEYIQAQPAGIIACIDRWSHAYNLTVSVDQDAITIKSKVTDGSYSFMVQFFEPSTWNLLQGKQVTVSALVKGSGTFSSGLLNRTNISKATILNEDNFILHSHTFVIPLGSDHGNNAPYFSIYEKSGCYAKIAAAKLELGSIQTLAHQENGGWVLNEVPDFTEELMTCQKYQLFGDLYGRKIWTYGNNVGVFFPTPVPMRGNSTIVGQLMYQRDGSSEPIQYVSSKPLTGGAGENGVYIFLNEGNIDWTDVNYFYFLKKSGFDAT